MKTKGTVCNNDKYEAFINSSRVFMSKIKYIVNAIIFYKKEVLRVN